MPTQTKKPKTQTTNNGAINPSIHTNLRHEIEKRAYEFWLSAGSGHGDDVAHWLQAENEVLAERQRNSNQAH